MPIIKAADFIEVYRAKASASDINELSGRTGRPDLTKFVNSQILPLLQLSSDDTLVDIGCGTGGYLRRLTGVWVPMHWNTANRRGDLSSGFDQSYHLRFRSSMVGLNWTCRFNSHESCNQRCFARFAQHNRR